MNNRKIITITTGLVLVASMALAMTAFAQNNRSGQGQGLSHMNNNGVRPMGSGVLGTVTAISGNTITMNGRKGFGSTTTAVIYTVDATNAAVKKANATSTVASIAAGDMIVVQGKVTGTNILATSIHTGFMGVRVNRGSSTSTPVLGNGQPVVAGTVSAIDGNTLTITNSSNVTYTIDASSSKVLQIPNTTVALSSVVIGDKVLVQGVVNGTSIVAYTIIDQKIPVNQSNPGDQLNARNKPITQSKGVFAKIGSFFSHLFGF